MSRDLDQILRDTAVTPDDAPDPAGLARRGRRRRRRRHAAGAASATAVAVAIGVVGVQALPSPAPQIVDQPEDVTPTPTASCDGLAPSLLPSGTQVGAATLVETDGGPGRSWGTGRDEVILVSNEVAWALTGGREAFLDWPEQVTGPDGSQRRVVAVGESEGAPVQIRVRDGDCDLLLFHDPFSYEDAIEYASWVTFGPDTDPAPPATSDDRAEPPVIDFRGCGYPAEVDMGSDEISTPLYAAVVEGDIAAAEALLRDGADPNVIDVHLYDTPLSVATFSRCIELVELLLDAGADPTLVTAAGTPPINHAVNVGDPVIVDLLLGAGADPSHMSTSKVGSALHEAVGVGRLSLLPRLLEHASDIDVGATGLDPLATRDDIGLGSPLEFAAEGRPEAASILLASGATPTRTALYRAVRGGHTQIVVELVAAGAPLDPPPAGRTFADVATYEGHHDLARYLRDVANGVPGASSMAQLNAELVQLIHDAGFEPLGGDHGGDSGRVYATNNVEDDGNDVAVALWGHHGRFERPATYADVEVYEGQDGGGATVELGTWPDGRHIAFLYCGERLLIIDDGDRTEIGRQRVERLAQPFAAVMGCGFDG